MRAADEHTQINRVWHPGQRVLEIDGATMGLFEIFIENLTRYQKGEPLLNVVDKKLGYQ